LDLQGYFNLPVKLIGENPKDSLLISVKSAEGKTKTISIDAISRKVFENPYFTEDSKPLKPKRYQNILIWKILKSVFGWIVLSFSLLILAMRLLGVFHFNVVLTGSMQPSINPGDMIFAVSDTYKKPKLNNVIIYEAKRFDGEVIAPFAHRIVGGDAKTGWITKGDANEQADVQKPNSEDITGVVILTIPNVGLLLNIRSLIFLSVIVISIYLTKEILRGTNE